MLLVRLWLECGCIGSTVCHYSVQMHSEYANDLLYISLLHYLITNAYLNNLTSSWLCVNYSSIRCNLLFCQSRSKYTNVLTLTITYLFIERHYWTRATQRHELPLSNAAIIIHTCALRPLPLVKRAMLHMGLPAPWNSLVAPPGERSMYTCRNCHSRGNCQNSARASCQRISFTVYSFRK